MRNPTAASILLILIIGLTETIAADESDSEIKHSWRSLGGDFKRTGLSENSGPDSGCVKWKFETERIACSSVTISSDNKVHIACEDGILYTLDLDGKLIWSVDANSPLLSSPSVGPDGTLYVGSEDGKLRAIGEDGSLLWIYETKGIIHSSPAISADGKIYFGSQDGILYTLDLNGNKLWSFETNGPGEVPKGSIFASPAIGDDGTVYIAGLYDPNLYALDPNDGSIKWTCNFESRGWPFASPVIAQDGTIYQTLLYDSNLYAIDSSNGHILWSTDLDINSFFVDNYILRYGELPPMEQIKDNCVYWIQFPTETDTLEAYIQHRDSSIWSEPALGPDGTIYVSFDDPYLRAVDPEGNIKWIIDIGVVGGFTLTVDKNGLIYAAGNDGFLYVVDSDGWEVARFSSGNWLNYPVITPDNTIIVSDARDDSLMITDSNNTVWAIGLDDCDGKTFSLQWIEDLDADGNVNFADLAFLADEWLSCTDTDFPCNYEGDEMYLISDIDRDRYTFFSDLVMMADRWLGSTRTPKGPRSPKHLGPPPGWLDTPEPPIPTPKGRACFPADTPVWIEGKLVQISDAVSGQIAGLSGREPTTSFLGQIEKIQEHEGSFERYDILLQTGDCISVAESHYFLTDSDRWIRVQDLKVGSRLKSLYGPVRVNQITKRQKPYAGKCYNLKIKGTDHYFVGQEGIIACDW